MKKNLNLPKKKTGRLRNLFLTVCLLASVAASAQEKTVTGTVTDALGDPLIGATVLVQGTSNGVITDIDGRYSIQATPENTLDFSYVGMVKQAVKVGSQSVINVQMKDDSQMLAETVVIGYGSAKKRDLTGSITNIKGDEIANKPVVNPVSALQGKIAGVQVINSGKAGSDPEIRVRGTNSINGYKPLYVVDGLFNDNINFLNPQDIESMEILKDPSSLAIFGVRGANGVIIITTKKAKEGQTRVNINGSFGFKSITDKIALTDAEGFKLLYNEQLRNEGNPEYNFSDWTGNTNWQDEIFQTGFITNNNISITGASDKNSFYLGAGYAYEQGNIKHEKYSKITLNISNDYKVTDNLKVGFQFNGARMLPADTKSVATALRAAPVAHVFNSEYGLYTSLPGFQKAQMNNPMVDVDLKANTTKAENYRGSGNVYGQWDFLKHFQFKAMFSLDYASNSTRTYTPVIQVYDASVEGDIATLGNGKTGVSQAKETEMKVQSDYLLTYTNSWGDHSVTATAGFTTYYNKLENLNGARTQGVGLVIPDNPDKWYVSIGDAATATNGSTQWERSTVSVLARVLYNYKGKYLFNGSYRRDGSSRLSKQERWGNFWSVAGAWNIMREGFMSKYSFLSNLRIRASYGINGTLPSDNYGYMSLMSYTSKYMGNPGGTITTVTNDKLSWETSYNTNVGIDFGFFGQRLRGTVEYFNRDSKNLLQDVPISMVTGFSSTLRNVGCINNHGVEVELSGDIIDSKGWLWSAGVNATFLRSEVKELYGGADIIWYDPTSSDSRAQYVYREGQSTLAFYGYEWAGVDKTNGKNVYYVNDPKNGKAGDFEYNGRGATYDYNNANYTIIGNAVPKVYGGINTSVSYKGIALSLGFTYKIGGDLYDGAYMDVADDGYYWERIRAKSYYNNLWTPDHTNGTEPRIEGVDLDDPQQYSSRHLFNASYLRLKNLSLAYALPKAMTRKAFIENARLFFTASNLWTIAKYKEADPEVSEYGTRGWETPIGKTFVVGVELKF